MITNRLQISTWRTLLASTWKSNSEHWPLLHLQDSSYSLSCALMFLFSRMHPFRVPQNGRQTLSSMAPACVISMAVLCWQTGVSKRSTPPFVTTWAMICVKGLLRFPWSTNGGSASRFPRDTHVLEKASFKLSRSPTSFPCWERRVQCADTSIEDRHIIMKHINVLVVEIHWQWLTIMPKCQEGRLPTIK